MANVYLDDSILQAIGNAIRTQTGTTATFLPSEMPSAISMIGATTLDLFGDTDNQLRYWPGWEDASWIDIKYVMDEYGAGRRQLPEDIKPGCYKFWPIVKNGKEINLLFKLNSIVDNVLMFEATATETSDFLTLDEHLDALYEMSKYKNCLTNDKIFVLSRDKFNLDIEGVSWTSTPVICVTPGGEFIEAQETSEFNYVPMFSIGLHELGVDYNERREQESGEEDLLSI